MQRNKLKLRIISVVCLASLLMPIGKDSISYADTINPIMNGETLTTQYGSSYWSSSNLREWLNSDKSTVEYSSMPPSYKSESGFLNGFTEGEKNGIAITEKKSFLSNTYAAAKDGGGTSYTGHSNFYNNVFLGSDEYANTTFHEDWYAYKKDTDKVFLLNKVDLYWYLIRRGNNFEKTLTSQAKSKNNVSSDSCNWWIQGGNSINQYDRKYMVGGNGLSIQSASYANSKQGIVPTINLKPNYQLSNGKYARDLKIGDEVTFGKYLNANIVWTVINVSNDGYPMLLSKNVLDLKEFDAAGDKVKRNSDVINFGNPDISLVNGVQYKPTSMGSDTEPPKVTILNEDELKMRQNDKYTLNFNISDSGSGIKYIIKPDGSSTTEKEFSYTFLRNGNYTIKVMDNAGNYNEYLIPVNNINDKPFVAITPSTTNWTKDNVTVDISSSNAVRFNPTYSIILGKGHATESSGSIFPNYTSYVGKKFKVSGKVKLLSYDDGEALNHTVSIGASYKGVQRNNDYSYNMFGSWPGFKYISVRDLANAPSQEIAFDTEWQVPSNYSETLQPYYWSGVTQSSPNYTIEISDLKYELVDDSTFAVTGIQLPNGTVVNQKYYRDTISTEGVGNYTYSVIDNNGNSTVKTVNLKIDKTAPKAVISKSTNSWTNKDITLKIDAEDELSGVKRIMLPNGSWISDKKASFVVSNNSTYNFIVEDIAGNQKTFSIVVDNIDKTAPGASTINANDSWTNSQSVNVSISAPKDNESGIKYILYKLSGATTTGWVQYKESFNITNEGITTIESKVVDNVDNESTIVSKNIKIDREAPLNNDITIQRIPK